MMCGSVEYRMSKEMAKDILGDRKGPDKKIPAQKYLVNYVNEQMGLLYKCVKVTLF